MLEIPRLRMIHMHAIAINNAVISIAPLIEDPVNGLNAEILSSKNGIFI